MGGVASHERLRYAQKRRTLSLRRHGPLCDDGWRNGNAGERGTALELKAAESVDRDDLACRLAFDRIAHLRACAQLEFLRGKLQQVNQ